MTRPSTLRAGLCAGLVLLAGACGPKHRLGEYDFRSGALTVSADVPARPDVLTGDLWVDPSGHPLQAVLRAGARAAREVSARQVRERLDSATALVGLEAVLEERTLRRASRYLGAASATSEEESDYVLEVFVSEYGIRATDWDATAYFYMDAAGTLLDRADGSTIWRAELEAQDPVGSGVNGSGAVRDVVTAAAIAELTVEETVQALEELAEFAATAITERLRRDMAEARENR
ncbi:MAG TPA: hypothetical protein VK849_11255 [Longimicrobiales bacterium]|nr:hypothetical protein [Longimicrobiales bacterium]